MFHYHLVKSFFAGTNYYKNRVSPDRLDDPSKAKQLDHKSISKAGKRRNQPILSLSDPLSHKIVTYSKHKIVKYSKQQKRSNRSNLISIPLTNYFSNPSTQCNSLIFLLSNTRSLLPKIDDLRIILDHYGVSMAFITETWLNEKIDDAAVCIDSYVLARRDRIDKLGGGVCAFIKSSIPFKILSEFEDTNFETMWIYVRPHKLYRGYSCLIVCIVYKPPSSDNDDFIDHLHTTSILLLISTQMQVYFYLETLIDVLFHLC